MRAARHHARRDVRIEEIPEPELVAGSVVIDVAWCGICGTDLHEYLEGPIFVPAKGSPHPISGEEAPITLGHELSGTITALGEGVEVGPGHERQLSPGMSFIGLGGRSGGLAPNIVVQRRWVHPVGDVVTVSIWGHEPEVDLRTGLDGLVTEGFEQRITNNEHHVKILVDPSAG